MAGTFGKAEKCDIKKKGKGTKYVESAELGDFQMFMITDHLVRYYQTHPRFKTGDLMTKETAADMLPSRISSYLNFVLKEYRPLYQQQSK